MPINANNLKRPRDNHCQSYCQLNNSFRSSSSVTCELGSKSSEYQFHSPGLLTLSSTFECLRTAYFGFTFFTRKDRKLLHLSSAWTPFTTRDPQSLLIEIILVSQTGSKVARGTATISLLREAAKLPLLAAVQTGPGLFRASIAASQPVHLPGLLELTEYLVTCRYTNSPAMSLPLMSLINSTSRARCPRTTPSVAR